jgi:hypothetical protein
MTTPFEKKSDDLDINRPRFNFWCSTLCMFCWAYSPSCMKNVKHVCFRDMCSCIYNGAPRKYLPSTAEHLQNYVHLGMHTDMSWNKRGG